MDARPKPYWPAPGRPTSRFNELIGMGKMLDQIWKGEQASYRCIDRQGRVRTWVWTTIRAHWRNGL